MNKTEEFSQTVSVFLSHKGHTLESYFKLSVIKATPIRQILVWASISYYELSVSETMELLRCRRFNTLNDPMYVRSMLIAENQDIKADVDLFVRLDEQIHPREKKITKERHAYVSAFIDDMPSITTTRERDIAYRFLMEVMEWGDRIKKGTSK